MKQRVMLAIVVILSLAFCFAGLTLINLQTQVIGVLPVVNGGTGQSSTTAALNNLLPAQTNNATKVLKTDGTNVSWAMDNTGSGGASGYYHVTLCGTNPTVLQTFTNLGASWTEVGNQVCRTNLNLSTFTQVRMIQYIGAVQATAGTQIRCATDAAFSTGLTTLVLASPVTSANSVSYGSWGNIPANCLNASGVYIQAGMTGGNGTEDPTIRGIVLQFQ